jgi:hypothetical protein
MDNCNTSEKTNAKSCSDRRSRLPHVELRRHMLNFTPSRPRPPLQVPSHLLSPTVFPDACSIAYGTNALRELSSRVYDGDRQKNPTSRVCSKPFCRIFRVTSHFCKVRPVSVPPLPGPSPIRLPETLLTSVIESTPSTLTPSPHPASPRAPPSPSLSIRESLWAPKQMTPTNHQFCFPFGAIHIFS